MAGLRQNRLVGVEKIMDCARKSEGLLGQLFSVDFNLIGGVGFAALKRH